MYTKQVRDLKINDRVAMRIDDAGKVGNGKLFMGTVMGFESKPKKAKACRIWLDEEQGTPLGMREVTITSDFHVFVASTGSTIQNDVANENKRAELNACLLKAESKGVRDEVVALITKAGVPNGEQWIRRLARQQPQFRGRMYVGGHGQQAWDHGMRLGFEPVEQVAPVVTGLDMMQLVDVCNEADRTGTLKYRLANALSLLAALRVIVGDDKWQEAKDVASRANGFRVDDLDREP